MPDAPEKAQEPPGAGAAKGKDTVTVDYATYNPLSLVIKKKGWLEKALQEKGKKLEWVKSAGSNKANEALRSGTSMWLNRRFCRDCWPARTAHPIKGD